MYLLPLEYWEKDSLTTIGNGLGEFIKVVEETTLLRYTSYTLISVYMKLGHALLDSVSLLEWIQPLDYEHVPFRCKRCHAHGHLFHDFPLNMPPKTIENGNKPDPEGFTKVANRKRHTKKPPLIPKNTTPSSDFPSSINIFDILTNLEQLESDTHVLAKPSSIPSTYLSPTLIHSKTSHSLNVNTSENPASDSQFNTNPVQNKALWSNKIMDINDTPAKPSQPPIHLEGGS